MTRTVLDDFDGWPPSGQPLDFTEHQNFVQEVIDRIEPLPTTATGQAGQVALVNDTETGIAVAGNGDTGAAGFARREVWQFKPRAVDINVSDVLTDSEHLGALLRCNPSTPMTLTISISGSPSSGCSDGFVCEVLRKTGASTVSFAFSGVTNQQPDGNNDVIAGEVVRVYIWGTQVYLFGGTEA